MINNLEIKEIEINSPIESLKIGDDFSYKGNYINGYEQGVSKIKRFYKELPFYNNNEQKIGDEHPVWLELENTKLVLLGYVDNNNNNFRMSTRLLHIMN